MDREYELRVHKVLYEYALFLKERVEGFEDTDDWWLETVDKAYKLSNGTKFADDLGVLMLNELARMAKKERITCQQKKDK